MRQIVALNIAILLLLIVVAPGVQAVSNKHHAAVIAARACIEQMSPMLKNRRRRGGDIECDIPVSLSENDLDELFKAAARSASRNEKIRSAAEKYSSQFAKTLTNFRAADCHVKLRINRSKVVNALDADNAILQLADQPTDCQITTKSHQIKKLSFGFSPRIELAKGCVKKFELNMGEIDAGCKICYFNRLYLSTKLVSLWANSLSANIKRALNIQLDKQCLDK